MARLDRRQPPAAGTWRSTAAGALQALCRRGFLVPAAVVVPLSSMLAMLVTVVVCLLIWRASPSYSPGLLFPAISELGVDLPQKRVYQVGFSICGAFLALGFVLFDLLVAPLLLWSEAGGDATLKPGAVVTVGGLKSAPHLNGKVGQCLTMDEASSRWRVELGGKDVKAIKAENLTVEPFGAAGSEEGELLESMLKWVRVATAGIVSQGLFTLERAVSMQSIIHWTGAIMFMAGAMNHAKASNDLYGRSAKRETPFLQNKSVRAALRLRCWILDYSSGIMFLAPLSMQILPALRRFQQGASAPEAAPDAGGSAQNASDDARKLPMDPGTMNTMGLMQWGMIFEFAVYFCTYTADLSAAASASSAPPPAAAPAAGGSGKAGAHDE